MATTIAVTNQKGGVGKTTTAINLAYYLARAGKRVLLVDFDPQGNASSGLGVDKATLKRSIIDVIAGEVTTTEAVVTTNYKNLWLIPTTSHLANSEVELAQASGRFQRLQKAIREVDDDFDIILIDLPPSLSLLTINGLIAAKYVLLPVQAEFYALEGLSQLLETIRLLRQATNPTLELIGVLPTMVDSRTTLSAQVVSEIHKHFPGKVFKNSIPRNIRLAEAPSHGLPVGDYDRFSKGARAYKALAQEVIERIG